jgi:PIN domain nuclease of toxin-antitoxin system
LRFLLDTHLLLWWLANDLSLPSEAKPLIADPANAIFVSTVSLWEIWLKCSIGKLEVPADFDQRLAAEQLILLPLESDHARGVLNLPWFHRDPFDRVLVAQAIAEKLILLTADDTLERYGAVVRRVR